MGGGDDAEGGALVAKAAVESHIAAVVREESTRLHPAPASPASPDAGAKKKLGTIKGVFVPTMQNILGVILFLRVPFIVGQAGILEGLAIVWLSCATTLLTSISMSAIATNGVPRGGGCYTMIKNALGAQFGGVTGTLLFLSNTFGVAMYVLGCVEVLKDCFPAVFEGVNDRLLGVAVLASLSLIVFVGVEYIARFAVVFLAGVVLSVLSIWAGVITAAAGADKPNQGVVGFSGARVRSNFGSRYTRALGIHWDFKQCLALFFPAVTDPLAGSNLSGDLADPQGSIPPGTLAAVVATIAIFTVQVVLVAGGSCRRRSLVDDPFIVSSIAWPSDKLVCVGVLLSTLGAGLQSLAGAPRLLAAIGRDGLIPPLELKCGLERDADGRRHERLSRGRRRHGDDGHGRTSVVGRVIQGCSQLERVCGAGDEGICGEDEVVVPWLGTPRDRGLRPRVVVHGEPQLETARRFRG